MTSVADDASPRLHLLEQLLVPAVSAVVSAFAAAAVVHFSTPIDDALPLLAVVLCVIAAVSTPVVMLSVPLVIGGEIVIADERTRLLWFGGVIAVSFAVAMIGPPSRFWRAATLTVCAIVVLRWIPYANVRLAREIVLLLLAIAIVAAFRSTALGIPIAVGAALFTPLIPLRTLWLPLAALTIGLALLALPRPWPRNSVRPGLIAVAARILPAAAVGLVLMFFAWSGVVARAFPMIWRGLPKPTARQPIGDALAAGEAVDLDVPAGARALIVSGANVVRLPRGTLLGRIDPGGAVLRIGDVADWGALRREHFYSSRNRLPRNPAGLLRDYGYAAWIDGASRVPLPHAPVIRVTADRGLPPDVRLQVQFFELEKR